MTPIKNLNALLTTLQPKLHDGRYVYCCVDSPPTIPHELIIASIREPEGTTLILSQTVADQYGLKYEYICAWITLEVHSALEAVGLTAAFANALSAAKLSCNVVAGYHHDHIFVAYEEGKRAIQVLRELSASHQAT